ncbi:MAG: InlB B-repeat-containing protein, partial [Aristaeellaceae bacterium]
ESIAARPDGTTEVTFRYADPEDYIAELDLHTTEQVNLEEQLTVEQIEQIEKTIAAQLADNDELKAQMLVAVMTSEETQRLLDDKYGEGTYSLAALTPIITDPKLDIKLTVKDSTAVAGIGVGIKVSLYGPQGLLVAVTPYLYFEEQLTLDVNMDGGFLWVDTSVLFRTKTTVSLKITATTGDDMDDVFDEALTTLREIVQPDGTAVEDYDYQEAADTLMNTMSQLIEAELEYQDLFAVPLFKFKITYYGIITFGVDVELVGQAAVVATFGVTVTAEYGQKIGFNYNFLKFKGGSYKEKLASEVTTEVYLIGKMGVRVGISVTLYIKLLQNVKVSITGSVFAYVEIAGMFLYTYALSAGGGNMAGSIYLEVGIDAEIELGLEVEVFIFSKELSWTLWSERWPLYTWSRGMTMSVVQNRELDAMWERNMVNADGKTIFAFQYLPMKTYDMLTAECTNNQLLFENLKEGNVTAQLTLENIVINGEEVSPDDPRIDVIIVGDGENGHPAGSIYADEMAAASYKVTDYACDVVLTYDNTNKSELIKHHRQVFHFEREFRMATTTVNVNISLYDWCAHAWGIEAAEWDNATVFTTSLEHTHVLGCPVEPSGTGEISLDAVIAAVKKQYPELEDMGLSWFNPTRNQVDRTVQYSIPRVSGLCYLTPDSGTVRFDTFETSNEYDLNFRLFANRFPGYTSEITYIIEAPEAINNAVFTLRGRDTAEEMTFTPVEGEENRWSLTADRVDFNGVERPVMLSINGSEFIESGLTVTGREAESVVVLTLGDLSHSLSVSYGEGIDSWSIESHARADMSSITPGDRVVLSAELQEGYKSLRLTTEPANLRYTVNGTTVTFTMPLQDVRITLRGVRSYQANFMYNYGELGTYQTADVLEDSTIEKPADPTVEGLTFAGWYDNAACEGEPYDFTRKMDGDVTLYADWRVNVTVDLGGAKGTATYVADRRTTEIDGDVMVIVDKQPIFPGDESEYTSYTYATHKLGDTALEYVLPNYEGYDFIGWYLTPDFTGESVNPAEYVLTGGVTFYACWRQTAILTYELNDGAEHEEPYAMTAEHVGMPLAYLPEAPEREYYKFLGWFRTQSGGIDNYIDTDEYLVEGSMTLYAGWKPVDYLITYELNGGENNPANPSLYNIESGEIVFAEPTRRGYKFLGWTATGAEVTDGVARIPAGSTGSVSLTAQWELAVYTISCDTIRGELAVPAPATYTMQSPDIVLGNPVANGYEFLGWTGTDLTEPTLNVVIPAGSVGDRSYRACWSTNVADNDIVQAALNAIPGAYMIGVNDYTGIQDIQTLAEDVVSADATCAPYIDMLSVTAEQVGEMVEDGTGYSCTVKVTVTYTDDDGKTIVRSKNVALKVAKNPVTITADVVYPIGGSYIAYGTRLEDVALTGCTAVSGDTAVEGSFAWADADVVPLAADNGRAIYRVVFTPEDTDNYSTAEALLAVNTQIGVRIALNVPETIEYTGLALDDTECGFLAVDAATGEVIDGVTLSIEGAVLEQSQVTPGNATITLAGYETCELQGVTDADLYVLVGTDATAGFTITRASTMLTGTMAYTADYGTLLSGITLNLHAVTAEGVAVDGRIAWEPPATRLGEVGVFTYKVTFTPNDLNCYATATVDVQVTVEGYPGKVTYILEGTGVSDNAEFIISGTGEAMTFMPVEGVENRWTLTVNRAAFDGSSEYPIVLRRSGSATVETGLTVTGREAEDEVTLTLNSMPRALTVTTDADSLGAWTLQAPDGADLSAIEPGEVVVIAAELLGGYNNLRLTSEPEGLSYIPEDNTITFVMPNHDLAIELRGVTNYQANCYYNYDGLGFCCMVEAAEDGNIVRPEDPTVEGLTFAGWYDNAECTGDPFDFSQTLSGNIKLYADWRVNVTVDFCGQKAVAAYYAKESGEEVPEDSVTEEGYTYIFPGDTEEKERYTFATRRVGETMLSVVIPVPDDYDFAGWYLTPDYTGDEVNLYGYVLTGGVSFYAKWYKWATLSFMMNDGTETQHHWTSEYVGELVTQNPPTEPERTGYDFTGWYRTPACLEADRVDLATYLVEGDMTLYAGWKPTAYTITYALNGGVNAPANPATYTIEDDRIDFAKPTREGYEFAGWETQDPVKADDSFTCWLPAGSTGNATLTAKWTPIEYAISYALGGGAVTGENPTTYNIESDAITLTNPTRDGYDFIGWTGTGLTEATLTVTIPTGSMGVRSYTANWQLSTPVADILSAARSALPNLIMKTAADFGNDLNNLDAADFVPYIEEILAADATCAPYAGSQITVTVEQDGDALESDTDHIFMANVRITFTEDDGSATSVTKSGVTLHVTKNAVTINAEPVYTLHNSYYTDVGFIAFGTSLKDVELEGTATDAAGNEVEGTFAWADGSIVPKHADNDKVMYQVVFTPNDT